MYVSNAHPTELHGEVDRAKHYDNCCTEGVEKYLVPKPTPIAPGSRTCVLFYTTKCLDFHCTDRLSPPTNIPSRRDETMNVIQHTPLDLSKWMVRRTRAQTNLLINFRVRIQGSTEMDKDIHRTTVLPWRSSMEYEKLSKLVCHLWPGIPGDNDIASTAWGFQAWKASTSYLAI